MTTLPWPYAAEHRNKLRIVTSGIVTLRCQKLRARSFIAMSSSEAAHSGAESGFRSPVICILRAADDFVHRAECVGPLISVSRQVADLFVLRLVLRSGVQFVY